MYRHHLAIIMLVLTFCVLACSTTTTNKIVTEHRNEEWQARALDSVLVIGAYDRTYRISAESVFAAELTDHGVKASPSYQLFPDLGALDEASQVRETIEGKGFDAILTIGTLKRGKEYRYDDWWATYGVWTLLGGSSETAARVADVHDADDYYSQGELQLDIGLFDATTLEPIWNATTDSYALSEGAEDVKILADFIVEELKKRRILE